MKSYEIFDALLEEFSIAITYRKREISSENLNAFFQFCRNYYSMIENVIKQDPIALKILIRMISPLPINRENVRTKSEAGRMFTSIVLKLLSETLQVVWATIIDTEWSSFREGLKTLFCINLHNQESETETNDFLNLLSTIPEEAQRQETVNNLLTLLGDLQCTLPRKQEVILYELVGRDNLTLEHLALAASLETYISYLTQLVMAHKGDYNELAEKIHIQLDKLLRENHFLSKK
jgi:hypothetical protein